MLFPLSLQHFSMYVQLRKPTLYKPVGSSFTVWIAKESQRFTIAIVLMTRNVAREKAVRSSICANAGGSARMLVLNNESEGLLTERFIQITAQHDSDKIYGMRRSIFIVLNRSVVMTSLLNSSSFPFNSLRNYYDMEIKY